MHLLSYRGFVAIVEYDPALGAYMGSLQDVADAVRFQAPDLNALPERMASAVDDYLALLQEWGLPCDRPFSGDRQVRMAVHDPAG